MAHYYACKFGVNRLRIDGDIREKAAITAIMENVVIAIYWLRPIQSESSYSIALRAHLQICRLPCHNHKGPYFTPKHHQKMLGLSLKFTKTVSGWGFAPDPTGGAYDAPPDLLVGSSISAPGPLPTHIRRVPPHFFRPVAAPA